MNDKEKQETLCIAKAIAYHQNRISIAFAILKNNYQEGTMGYVHALEILPEGLIEKIQEYVDGQVIYIPKTKSKKCKWGEKTDTKAYFKERNFEIFQSYNNGTTVYELSEIYFLTPKSIQRIIRSM